MNNFQSGVIFCCQKGPFLAETAVQSRKFPVLDMFVNTRHKKEVKLKKCFL